MRAEGRPDAAPRWATPRRPERATLGPVIAKMAEQLGKPLMPWQRLVADVGTEYDPATGVPFYREVTVTVPRQAGKTTLDLSLNLEQLCLRPDRRTSAYTAQTGADARDKLLQEQVPLLRDSPALWGTSPTSTPSGDGLVANVARRSGAEAVEFVTGSRLIVVASGAAAGHGKTLHRATLDEMFKDHDLHRPQSLLPAMITIDDAQVWGFSTAGTDASVLLNSKVRQGRKAVDDGVDSGVAYFEWSAPEGADIDDEELWWSVHPALGYTQSIDAMRATRMSFDDPESGGPDEFRRAFLNIPTIRQVQLIPADAWEAVQVPTTEPSGELTLSFDCTPNRDAAAIAVASDVQHLALLDHRAGTGWLVDRLCELSERTGAPVAADSGSGAPGNVFLAELEHRGVEVVRAQASEFTAACGAFYDAVVNRQIEVRPHRAIDAAVSAAKRRSVGDSWAWARKVGAHDATPLVAMSMALWGSRNRPEVAVDPVFQVF